MLWTKIFIPVFKMPNFTQNNALVYTTVAVTSLFILWTEC